MSRGRNKSRRVGSAPSSPAQPSPHVGSLVASRTHELRLYGDIGDGKCTGDGVRAQLAGASGDVAVRINSDGGVVTQGVAIYHELRRHAAKGRVITYCDGLAASIASIVFQAGDERHIARGAYVMIHNPSSPAGGESEDLRKTADVLDSMRDDMVSIYCSRTGLARDEVIRMMAEETYLSADKAVELGFADVIDELEAKIELKAVARLSRGKNLPGALGALLAKGSTMTAEEENEMRAQLEALKAENSKLKAEKEDESEDDKPHDEEGSEDEKDEEKEAKAVLDAARRFTGKRSLAEVEGALMAASANTFSARAAEVEALIKSGKLARKDKDWALACSAKAFGAYKAAIGSATVVPLGSHKEPTVPANEEPEALSASEKAAIKAGIPKELVMKARTASPMGTKQKESE